MKILLASPESDVWNSRKHIHMGLGYLAGSLRTHGYKVDIWDASIEVDFETLDERLTRDPYHIIGLSAPTPLIVNAWEAAIKAKRRGVLTILGGPHLTLMPDESMHKDAVDLVVRGEAEYTIIEIMRALEKETEIRQSKNLPPISNISSSHLNGSHNGNENEAHHSMELKPQLFHAEAGWGSIMGLSWRNRDGKIVHNMERILPNDIDAIPFPAHDMFKIDRYTNLNPLTEGLDMASRTYTIVTSRGCPYKCIYCSKPITGDTWRARSVDNVVAEWEWLVKDLGATEIGVTDDIWNHNRDRAKDLCRAIIKANINHVPWVTVHGMKVNNTDRELFDLMKQAGCKRVGFGIENGDDWMLRNIIKKGQTVDMVRQAMGHAKAAKLETMGFFIFGMPGETVESMEKTINLALELDPDLAHFMMAAPFPGTAMWETLKEHGDVFSDQMDWSQLAIQSDRAHFAFGELDKETVEKKFHEAHRRFYLRPHRMARILKRKDTWMRFPYYLKTAGNMLVGLGDREPAA
ncbi:radical SAM protein [Anaerolineales bacterium HSG6]|nr:radical SAM protein [Anaerolineales bacterium HSG6]